MTPLSVFSQQWIALGGTSYNQYYVQEGSLRISGNSISMTSQNVNRINNRIYYTNSVTSIDACRNKQGPLTVYNLNNKFLSQGMFALGGKEPYGLIGTAICATYHNYLLANNLNKPEIIAKVPTVKEEPIKETVKPAEKIIEPSKKSPDNVWQQLALNDKSEIAIKTDSFVKKNINGQELIGVTGRNVDVASNKTILVNWYVTQAACNKQQGKLITVNIDGSDSYDNNFVLGSGSMGSIIAESICNQQ